MPYDETRNQMIFSRPDLLLASNCFSPVKHPTKDAIGTFLDDDLEKDCKKLDSVVGTPSDQPHDHGSSAWSAMPMV